MPKRLILMLMLCLVPIAVGCSYQPSIERTQLDRGYIMLLTGVECYGSYHRDFVRGLREGGVDRAIEINEWGSKPFGTFKNLANYEENHQIAARAAKKIVTYAQDHPHRPITILGYSGGGAMVLWLAEALPEAFQVDQIILTGVAISPEYDPTHAMSHARRGLVSFYSSQDWFMGGLATQIWGTMDRKKSSTAGRLGFQDADGRLLVRDGLEQIPWRPEWSRLGHDGGHAGWRAGAAAREVLAPCLIRKETLVYETTNER